MKDEDAKAFAFVMGVSRWLLPLSYVLAVWMIISAVQHRSLPPLPTATRDLDRNHLVVAGDLETAVTASMLGKYVKKDLKKGTTVEADAVSDKPLAAPIPSTMAAIVAISVATQKSEKIDEGQSVRICVNRSPFAGPSKVLRVECDEQICSVAVALPRMPGQIVDPDALSNARLVGATSDCSTAVP